MHVRTALEGSWFRAQFHARLHGAEYQLMSGCAHAVSALWCSVPGWLRHACHETPMRNRCWNIKGESRARRQKSVQEHILTDPSLSLLELKSKKARSVALRLYAASSSSSVGRSSRCVCGVSSSCNLLRFGGGSGSSMTSFGSTCSCCRVTGWACVTDLLHNLAGSS